MIFGPYFATINKNRRAPQSHDRLPLAPPQQPMRILFMAAEQGPHILLFMSNRTRQIPFIPIPEGADAR
jgi:hypothetical protein